MAEPTKTVTGEQIQAARALLRWSQSCLSVEAKVSVPTIKRLEGTRGPVRGTYETVSSILSALAAGGVEFTDDGGVRPRART